MDALEKLLQENLIPLQRYVHFKIQNRQDAEDIIQDVCLTAALKFDTLHRPEAFKAWLIGIARHKCLDYYRRKAAEPNISLDTLPESALRVWLGVGSPGITERSMVRDTMDSLGDKEKQIFYLFFFRNLSQKDISRKLVSPSEPQKAACIPQEINSAPCVPPKTFCCLRKEENPCQEKTIRTASRL